MVEVEEMEIVERVEEVPAAEDLVSSTQILCSRSVTMTKGRDRSLMRTEAQTPTGQTELETAQLEAEITEGS